MSLEYKNAQQNVLITGTALGAAGTLQFNTELPAFS